MMTLNENVRRVTGFYNQSQISVCLVVGHKTLMIILSDYMNPPPENANLGEAYIKWSKASIKAQKCWTLGVILSINLRKLELILMMGKLHICYNCRYHINGKNYLLDSALVCQMISSPSIGLVSMESKSPTSSENLLDRQAQCPGTMNMIWTNPSTPLLHSHFSAR